MAKKRDRWEWMGLVGLWLCIGVLLLNTFMPEGHKVKLAKEEAYNRGLQAGERHAVEQLRYIFEGANHPLCFVKDVNGLTCKGEG